METCPGKEDKVRGNYICKRVDGTIAWGFGSTVRKGKEGKERRTRIHEFKTPCFTLSGLLGPVPPPGSRFTMNSSVPLVPLLCVAASHTPNTA